jgi:hypothetical protein
MIWVALSVGALSAAEEAAWPPPTAWRMRETVSARMKMIKYCYGQSVFRGFVLNGNRGDEGVEKGRGERTYEFGRDDRVTLAQALDGGTKDNIAVGRKEHGSHDQPCRISTHSCSSHTLLPCQDQGREDPDDQLTGRSASRTR